MFLSFFPNNSKYPIHYKKKGRGGNTNLGKGATKHGARRNSKATRGRKVLWKAMEQ
jgi:hypothetical protein